MAEALRRTVVQVSRDRRSGDIEEAARDVFCERGFDAASTAEIAARAGVAEGTLYKYFQNKRALLIKVLASWYQSMLSDFASQLEAVQGTRNKVYYIISRHLHSLKDNAELARLSYHEVRHSGDYYESEIYSFNREYTQVLVTTLREGINKGELRESLPVSLVRDLIFGGIDHLISGFLFNQRPLDIKKSAEELVTLIFEGVAASEMSEKSLDKVLHRFDLVADRMEEALAKK